MGGLQGVVWEKQKFTLSKALKGVIEGWKTLVQPAAKTHCSPSLSPNARLHINVIRSSLCGHWIKNNKQLNNKRLRHKVLVNS